MTLSNPSDKIIWELKKQNKQKWHCIINRQEIPPLEFSVSFYGLSRINKILGTDWTIESLKWQDGVFYIAEKDKQKMLHFLREKLESDKSFILKILRKGE